MCRSPVDVHGRAVRAHRRSSADVRTSLVRVVLFAVTHLLAKAVTYAEASGNSLEPVTPPAVTKRERNREHLRPAPRRDAIEIANQLLEQVVGEEFPDDQFQECARPGQPCCASSKESQRSRAQFVPPSLGIVLLLRPSGLFQVAVDVDDGVTDLAHDQTSTNRGTHTDGVPRICGGPGPTARYGV